MTCPLTDHIMSCDYCNGMAEKHCSEGWALFVEVKAAWIAGLPTSQERQDEYWRIAAANPAQAERIKKRAAALFRDASSAAKGAENA